MTRRRRNTLGNLNRCLHIADRQRRNLSRCGIGQFQILSDSYGINRSAVCMETAADLEFGHTLSMCLHQWEYFKQGDRCMSGSQHGHINLGAQTQLQAKTTSTPLTCGYQVLMPTEHERLGVAVMCVDTWDACPPTLSELLVKLRNRIQAIRQN